MGSGSGDRDDGGDWLAQVGAASTAGREAAGVDWSTTPLGPPSRWPAELRSSVRLCLSTRFPMFVAWGDDLTMIYNDGYRLMIGDLHPAALGAPLAVVWAGIWQVIGPLVDEVMGTGRPIYAEHERLLIDRKGFVEETYFTFSYSPAHDEDGTPAGIIGVATETTEQILAQRRLTALADLGLAALSAQRVTDVCVAATNELARRTDDIVHADVYLRVQDDLVLIASTPQIERRTPSADLLREVSRGRTPRVERPAGAPADAPAASVVLPLAGDGEEPSGALYVEPSTTLPYSEEHETFLLAVARTIGGALGAAYSRTVELGEQRHINETLQRAMLQPASDHPTVAARYRPAVASLAVGGDWYDVIDLDEHRRAMVVGDCVGHGLDAATAMGQLRSATRALLLEGHDPAAALERLDRFSTSIPGAFATSVACVVVDRLAATVQYSRAGHVPPLLVDRGGCRWLDDATGPPLQTVAGWARPSATVDYADGDLLVLYTDGLVERRRDTIDHGMDRLRSAAGRWFEVGAPLPQMADGLLRDLLTTQRQDDVVLVVKRLVVDRP